MTRHDHNQAHAYQWAAVKKVGPPLANARLPSPLNSPPQTDAGLAAVVVAPSETRPRALRARVRTRSGRPPSLPGPRTYFIVRAADHDSPRRNHPALLRPLLLSDPFSLYDLTMPHAVPPNPSSRPALKHKQQPAMARSQTRQQSAYGYSATPARRNQALEAWTRVARTHADIIRAIGEGASSASESSVTDDISSQPSRLSSTLSPQNTFAASSSWYPIDHRRHLDASPQHTNGASQYRWAPSPAPVMLTRDALSSLEATAGNDLYSPSRNSAVISFCSTNLSDIDQRGSNGTTQYADDERYTEVSPGSSLWASVDDQVSDIVFEEPSPPSEPAVEWTVSRTMFEESHVSSLQLELSPPDADLPRDNGLEDYAVDRARVMEEYIVAPVVEEYTELVIEAPSGPPVITPEYRKMADHLSEWVADWLWKVVNSANFAEALSKQSNTAGRCVDACCHRVDSC